MSELTAAAALKLVGEIFVYHMPFNRALGLELERYEKEFAQLSFNNQPMMVGGTSMRRQYAHPARHHQ